MIALLASGHFYLADLYTFTLKSGTIVRLAPAETDLSYGGATWLHPADQTYPVITRGETRNPKGLEVGNCDLTLLCGDEALFAGVRAPLFAHNGGFDGARVAIQRAVMPTWGDTSCGLLWLFEGDVAPGEVDDLQVVLHLKDDREKLNLQMPRNLYEERCSCVCGDANCGLDLSTVTETGTLASGSTTAIVRTGLSTQAAGYYVNGVLSITSGACAGSSLVISAWTAGGYATVSPHLPAAPAAGDSYEVSWRCPRTKAACPRPTYFRGCPYIPVPETAY